MTWPDPPVPPDHLAPDHLAAVQRRTLRVVVASQVLGGAGLAAGVSVGALLAEQLLGSTSVAGLPAGLFTLGSAAAAFTVGRVSQAAGRRHGLTLGFLAGAVGAVGIVLAAVLVSAWLFFPSLLVYGAGTATNLQARYAGTDLASPARRASAVSTALVATTVGAVAGPNLVEPMGRLAQAVGVPALAGPFLLAAVAYGAAATVLAVALRPDPLLTARAAGLHASPPGARPDPGPAGTTPYGAPVGPWRRVPRPVVAGATTMVLTQVTMTAVMTMTPVHMRAHGHGLGEVGLVISLHIAAMYLPSPLTGLLADRVGRLPVSVASAVTLVAAGALAALAPASSMVLLTLALVLLGLGWNLGLISGTALVVDGTDPSVRATVQGRVDVLIALAGAGASAASGLVVAMSGYTTLGLLGAVLAVLLLPVVVWSGRLPAGPRTA